MKTEYLVQWLGGHWNTYRHNQSAGDEIKFTSKRKAMKFKSNRQKETVGYKRVVKRITKETVVK